MFKMYAIQARKRVGYYSKRHQSATARTSPCRATHALDGDSVMDVVNYGLVHTLLNGRLDGIISLFAENIYSCFLTCKSH